MTCCGGFIDSGIPQGTEEKYAGINCYVAPKNNITNNTTAIILATDVFGYKLPNARLIADSFAKNGSVLTIVPDLFEGKEPPADLLGNVEALMGEGASFGTKFYSFFRLVWYFLPFIASVSPLDGVKRIENIAKELREKHGITKIAVQGYCWGGRIAVYLGQKPDVIDAFCAAHPGGLKLPADFEAVVKPACFVLPEKDHQIKEKQIAIIREIMQKKEAFLSSVKDYPGMIHGFAVRGNENDETVKKARVDAFESALAFFKQALQF